MENILFLNNRNDFLSFGMAKDLNNDFLNVSFDLTDISNTFNQTIDFESFFDS
jgi:hypothetical protein